jgi:putative peptide zinc metalloprotease protein
VNRPEHPDPAGSAETSEQPTQVGAPVEEQTQTPAIDGRPPQLAEGIELIGRYEDSGFKEAPYIARRADGQVIQLPQLLYIVAENVDGRRGYEEIAERVTEAFKRGVSGDNIKVLVVEKLRPLGVVAQPDGTSPELQKADPLLALKFRAALVPDWAVRAITTIFRPLFLPPVILGVLVGLGVLDYWLFFQHGVAHSAREVLYNPALLLMVLGLVILSAAFHESGHATACRYGGAKPGVMGAGIYIVWPAFYTDVTDAYRLGKGGRLRTDLGGVYFNVIFILGTAGAYFLTGYEPLLLIIPLQHLEIIHQFLPFIRLDGYYIVSDMTGVPDMFSRIKPTLKSLIPFRRTDDRVTELKPWVRGAVTLYVLTVIPLLLFMFGMMTINAPRIFATAWDSFFVQYHKVRSAIDDGKTLNSIVGGIQMVVLALPTAGIAATFLRTAKRFGGSIWGWTQGSPVLRSGFLLLAAGAAGLTAYIWWPNGEYRPIQPNERGTIQGAVKQFSELDTGRPGLTKERERQLGGAPYRSRNESPSEQPTIPPASTEQAPTSSTPTSTEPTATEPESTTPTSTTDTGASTTPTTPTETSTTSTTTTPTTTATTTTTTTTTTPTTTEGTP